MTEILKPVPELLLPETCWYSSRTNAPRAMKKHTAIGLHKISGSRDFPEDPFNIDRIIKEIMVPLRVSYNIVITREAEARIWVPLEFQSFHAGLSTYKGQNYCNRFMIGISLVSTGKKHNGEPAYLPEQITKLSEVIAQLIGEFHIGINNITTHELIRYNWNRKHPKNRADSREGDPGEEFDWENFRETLEEML